MQFFSYRVVAFSLSLVAISTAAFAADLTGHKLLVTSVRTGDTEVFIADPNTGDMVNVSRSPKSEDRCPCWSPDGKQICFMSDREGTTNLWVCNADGKVITLPNGHRRQPGKLETCPVKIFDQSNNQ